MCKTSAGTIVLDPSAVAASDTDAQQTKKRKSSRRKHRNPRSKDDGDAQPDALVTERHRVAVARVGLGAQHEQIAVIWLPRPVDRHLGPLSRPRVRGGAKHELACRAEREEVDVAARDQGGDAVGVSCAKSEPRRMSKNGGCVGNCTCRSARGCTTSSRRSSS